MTVMAATMAVMVLATGWEDVVLKTIYNSKNKRFSPQQLASSDCNRKHAATITRIFVQGGWQ